MLPLPVPPGGVLVIVVGTGVGFIGDAAGGVATGLVGGGLAVVVVGCAGVLATAGVPVLCTLGVVLVGVVLVTPSAPVSESFELLEHATAPRALLASNTERRALSERGRALRFMAEQSCHRSSSHRRGGPRALSASSAS
jgi:hypothetical protein